MEWTTDWFTEKGIYLIWSQTLDFVLVDYNGGGIWTISGKPENGVHSDTRKNWEFERDICDDPLWRSKNPLTTLIGPESEDER